MSQWLGDVAFLNKGQDYWQDEVGRPERVSWKFTNYKSPMMPFFFYSCALELSGIEVIGSASAESPSLAAKKAFAEAWERVWMIKTFNNMGDANACASSNGFAAGETSTQAAAYSRYELIERAIFIQAWRTQKGWERIQFKGLFNRILAVSLRARGWQPHLFNISSNVGTVKACLLINKKVGATFDIALSDISEDSETALLRSVIRSSFALKASSVSSDLPEIGKPEDHGKFYCNKNNLAAFDFLLKSALPTEISTDDSASMTLGPNVITLEGIESIHTTELVSAGLFPSVAYSTNCKWEPLTWGRISIKGVNPWPHPLA